MLVLAAMAAAVAGVVAWQVLADGSVPDPVAASHIAWLDIAVLVFREGLECVLVLSAITASMTGPTAHYRRPVAAGALASALSAQVSNATDTSGNVRIGLSFRAKDGNYCRTFALPRDSSAGVACRNEDRWQIEALARASGDASAPDYRQAATELPPVILEVVESTIEGEALDAEQEAAARARDWQRPDNDND